MFSQLSRKWLNKRTTQVQQQACKRIEIILPKLYLHQKQSSAPVVV